AYHLRTRPARTPVVSARTAEPGAPPTAAQVADRRAEVEADADAAIAVGPDATPATAAPRSLGSAAAPNRDELRLLSHAREAVARRDFAAALPPIAEHTRRFRDGRLLEEREALRVKALSGLGRGEEARRAATAFKRRFPHSVLL